MTDVTLKSNTITLNLKQINLSAVQNKFTLGNIENNEPQAVCPPELLNEIKDKYGYDRIKFCIRSEKVTNIVDGLLVSAFFTDNAGNVLHLTGLDTPVRLFIPVTDDTKHIPKWHDAAQGIWRLDGIFDIETSKDLSVAFSVNHLTDFALFVSAEPEIKEERSDTNTGSSSSSCFINTLF
ncbi:MAG: hypothetical protein U9P10_05120 [Thermodesulfobacteriota bacterium]|nr:hypothetical protein [Thermodesulfobacteriota bacterium]